MEVRTVNDAQLNRLPSQDKGARRVAFSDILPKHRAASSDGDDDEQPAKCHPRCFACCAWACLGVSGIVLVLLVLGVIFVSFLQSELPEITIEKLQFPKLEVVNSTNQKALLNAKTDLAIKMNDKNEIVDLSYSGFKVKVASEDVTLGSSAVAGFYHRAGNVTYLNVTTAVVGEDVDRDYALGLVDDVKNAQMVVQVTMEAIVGFHVGIFRLNNVPILVQCNVQEVLLINRLKEPVCNIRMFPTN